ncbi:hypothetical protein AAMO2058_000961300 [Amorphochlora amoebiformis]
MEALDTKQKATLQEYQSLVNAHDIKTSIQILNDCKWNLQVALNTAFEMQLSLGSGGGSASASSALPPAVSTSENKALEAPATLQQRPSASSGLESPTPGSTTPTASSNGQPEAGAEADWTPVNTLMASGMAFLAPVAHRVIPHWVAESQNIHPRAFTQQLKQIYRDLPNFFEGTYLEACRLARTQNRSLFIYIHCQIHEDTEQFINTSLCNQAVRETLNGNFVCWAGSVTQTDTHKLCQRLNIEGYPCVAVINPNRESSRIPAPLHMGLFPPEDMINWLHEVRSKYEQEMKETRRRRTEVKQSSQLREIQDMEYIQALQQDMEREEEEKKKKDLAAVAKMEEKRKKEEVERKQQEELKAAEEEKIKKLEKRKELGDEPAAGPGVVLVVIRLPDGQQIKRRFQEEATFGALFDLIETYELLTPHGEEIEKWVMRSRYPRKKWEDRELTLKGARMGRQALFFVQEDI